MKEFRSTWPDGSSAGAVFSDDERHRILLWCVFNDAPLFKGPRPRFPMFLMLNPSTATHEASDQTLTRCAGFARRWGYSSFHVCNLFSLRSTDPKALGPEQNAEGDPVNLRMILESAKEAELVVCAWGVLGEIRNRRLTVVNALRGEGLAGKLRCLGQTMGGMPRHPLYLSSETPLIPYLGLDFYAKAEGA